MRIPINAEFAARAKAEGLPMIRVQIDWRHVPKDKRTLKSHEVCGVTDIETARKIFTLSMRDFADLADEEPIEKCEGCDAPAATSDSEGVPLCAACFEDCAKDPACHSDECECDACKD